jgi:3-deoxy-D-manno-octulosonic-acid transferase
VFFASAPIALMGGSLLGHLKGHNPIEPTLLGAATVSGPFVESFADIYAAMMSVGGVRIVPDAPALATTVAALLGDEAVRLHMVGQARGCIAQGEPALAHTVSALHALLPEIQHETA